MQSGRVRALRRRMATWGRTAAGTALLVSNPRDIRYLTGFCGDDSWAVVTAKSGKVVVISDFRFEEEIEHSAPQVAAVMRKKALWDELPGVCAKLGVKRLAVQQDYLCVGERAKIAAVLPKVRLMEVDDGLIQQRAVKDQDEVALIRRGVKIQQEAMRRTIAWVKPGRTEQEVAAYLEYQMRLLGADGPSFPTIAAADANASLPHAVPGTRKVKKGGILLVDWGARVQGYCSDLTRVYALGKMPAKMREIYPIVLEAQVAAIEAVAPGRRMADVDEVARKIIRDAGYGERFGHGLGHGIGLDIHEQPTLSRRGVGVLQPGQIVTVEPGIYLPGVGGVRIEDDVLVTSKGKRVLSDLPKSLESAII
ncbi:MAG: aminopeptidase P family protein [Phycisphaeraceae bacterium]|nr:aminopeptidase P family protein [Phycisphaeraceae bacterium]